MLLEDPVLPAVGPLTGPTAVEVLRPAVEAAGGTLHGVRCSQVHYLVGQELVVRYRGDVTWANGRRSSETLLAATTAGGILPGTVALVADTPDRRLEVSVWRWPFDPLVVGLGTIVDPGPAGALVTGLVGSPVTIEVVAYRPTERAVSRLTDDAGRVLYLKAMRPEAAAPLPLHHQLLRSLGVPAPRVLAFEPELGVVVLAELPGPTLRQRIKDARRPWPPPGPLLDLLDRISRCPISVPARASRTRDALAHAELLASVTSRSAPALYRLRRTLAATLAEVDQRSGPVVHGDLHEGQLVIDDQGAVTGLLDIDDLGPGDPLDDPATLVGHLRYRALVTDDAPLAAAINAYADELGDAFARRYGARQLDLTVAAVLVGLATGPFRIQMTDWPAITSRVIRTADEVARNAGRSR